VEGRCFEHLTSQRDRYKGILEIIHRSQRSDQIRHRIARYTCMCVCVRERDREREWMCVCVCLLFIGIRMLCLSVTLRGSIIEERA
jgi:hypothetical protein